MGKKNALAPHNSTYFHTGRHSGVILVGIGVSVVVVVLVLVGGAVVLVSVLAVVVADARVLLLPFAI